MIADSANNFLSTSLFVISRLRKAPNSSQLNQHDTQFRNPMADLVAKALIERLLTYEQVKYACSRTPRRRHVPPADESELGIPKLASPDVEKSCNDSESQRQEDRCTQPQTCDTEPRESLTRKESLAAASIPGVGQNEKDSIAKGPPEDVQNLSSFPFASQSSPQPVLLSVETNEQDLDIFNDSCNAVQTCNDELSQSDSRLEQEENYETINEDVDCVSFSSQSQRRRSTASMSSVENQSCDVSLFSEPSSFPPPSRSSPDTTDSRENGRMKPRAKRKRGPGFGVLELIPARLVDETTVVPEAVLHRSFCLKRSLTSTRCCRLSKEMNPSHKSIPSNHH